MSRHAHMPTEQLELSVTAMGRLARRYAETGPKAAEDQLHQTIDEVLAELTSRQEQGKEVRA